jgi:hypothetical protein
MAVIYLNWHKTVTTVCLTSLFSLAFYGFSSFSLAFYGFSSLAKSLKEKL